MRTLKMQRCSFPFDIISFHHHHGLLWIHKEWTPCKIPNIFCRRWHFGNKGEVVMDYNVDRSLRLSLWPSDESASLPSAVRWWLIAHVHVCCKSDEWGANMMVVQTGGLVTGQLSLISTVRLLHDNPLGLCFVLQPVQWQHSNVSWT